MAHARPTETAKISLSEILPRVTSKLNMPAVDVTTTASFVAPDGLELHYTAHGPEDGLPVVFIHGLAMSRRSWADVAAHIPDHRVILVDLRGHGNSSRAKEQGEYTATRYAADMVAFLDTVLHGRECVMAGHSLGALTAYLVAMARPKAVKGVLLEDPPLWLGIRSDAPPEPGKESVGEIYRRLFTKHLADTLEWQGSGLSAADISAIVANAPVFPGSPLIHSQVFTEDHIESIGHGRSAMDAKMWNASLEGIMADHSIHPSSVRGILLRAQADMGPAFTAEHAEKLAPMAPNLEIVEIKGAGHNIHASKVHRDAVVGYLKKVLETVD